MAVAVAVAACLGDELEQPTETTYSDLLTLTCTSIHFVQHLVSNHLPYLVAGRAVCRTGNYLPPYLNKPAIASTDPHNGRLGQNLTTTRTKASDEIKRFPRN